MPPIPTYSAVGSLVTHMLTHIRESHATSFCHPGEQILMTLAAPSETAGNPGERLEARGAVDPALPHAPGQEIPRPQPRRCVHMLVGEEKAGKRWHPFDRLGNSSHEANQPKGLGLRLDESSRAGQ